MIISPDILNEIRRETYIISTNTGGTVTGTVAQTILWSVLIPANTLTLNSFINIKAMATCVGNNNSKTIRFYINSTNDLSGSPVVFSIWTGSSTILAIHGERSLLFKPDGTFITSTLNGSADIDDVKVNINSFARIPWDVTTAKYLLVVGNVSNIADSITLEGVEIHIRK